MRGSLLGGRYRIQNKIGEGGMAYVYVALDEKLQRKVAVKILHRHMADNADIRKRFFQEAQAISALDHPNILKIYDFSGEHSEELWIVTEILQGLNLNEFTNSFPGKWLHPIVAVIIVREIIKALEKAHLEGLVHRDVKPENIMVLNVGKIKLMDFGIAKNTRGNSITLTGTFMGSPSYMSPEQIRGVSVDGRSDLYSLGVLLYEIITGKLPYTGNSTHDVILKICDGNFKEPKILVPNLPDDLNKIIAKAMAKHPSNRYQEARTFARDLDIFLENNGFEESSIELERYFVDRDKFSDRLRKLDYTNNATVTAKVKSDKKSDASAELRKTKTQQQPVNHTRVLNKIDDVQLDAQKQNAAAINQPKDASEIAWINQNQNEPMQAARRDHQVPAHFSRPNIAKNSISSQSSSGNFSANNSGQTLQHLVTPQSPGNLRKKRARPRQPKRSLPNDIVYRMSFPANTDITGLILGVLLVGMILAGLVYGFTMLRNRSLHPIKAPKVVIKPEVKDKSPVESMIAPIQLPKKSAVVIPEKSPTPQPSTKEKKSPKKRDSALPTVSQKTNAPIAKIEVKKEPEAKIAAPIAEPTPKAAVVKTTSFRISSQPASEIYIDGKRSGTTVDRTVNSGWIALSGQRVVVELRRAGYETYRKIVSNNGTEKIDLGSIKLTPSENYELAISSSDVNVRVTLTNLSDHTQRSFTLNGDVTTQYLPSGRYKARFDFQGQVIERNIALTGSQYRRTLSVNFN